MLHAEVNVPLEIAFVGEDSRRTGPAPTWMSSSAVRADRVTVPAFWAGPRRVPGPVRGPAPGRWTYRTACTDAADAGLHGMTGEVEVVPYTGTNPLYRHGPLRRLSRQRHFEHADGTPFFWLGDTWWMGLCQRLHWPDEFQALAADRVEKGFNVIQIVAGLYPDMPAFDPRGANEAGFPWEPDYARIRPAYFDAADQRSRTWSSRV